MPDNRQKIEAAKVIGGSRRAPRRRWASAKVLFLGRTPDHELGEAYEIEFHDGSRGMFDMNYLRHVGENKPMPHAS